MLTFFYFSVVFWEITTSTCTRLLRKLSKGRLEEVIEMLYLLLAFFSWLMWEPWWTHNIRSCQELSLLYVFIQLILVSSFLLFQLHLLTISVKWDPIDHLSVEVMLPLSSLLFEHSNWIASCEMCCPLTRIIFDINQKDSFMDRSRILAKKAFNKLLN